MDIIVRYLNPPRNLGIGCVQRIEAPGLSSREGTVTYSTPSYDWLNAGVGESSDVDGLMKSGDSVNESARGSVVDDS